jgi:hypothetical protein
MNHVVNAQTEIPYCLRTVPRGIMGIVKAKVRAAVTVGKHLNTVKSSPSDASGNICIK